MLPVTSAERVLCDELLKKQLWFEMHEELCGFRPDFVFGRANLLVCTDSHLQGMRRAVLDAKAIESGWSVLRLDEREILSDADTCSSLVCSLVRGRGHDLSMAPPDWSKPLHSEADKALTRGALSALLGKAEKTLRRWEGQFIPKPRKGPIIGYSWRELSEWLGGDPQDIERIVISSGLMLIYWKSGDGTLVPRRGLREPTAEMDEKLLKSAEQCPSPPPCLKRPESSLSASEGISEGG